MSTPITTIIQWFRSKGKPTGAQFRATWNSFWHKEEKIPVTQIEGIDDLIADKADRDKLEAHREDIDAIVSEHTAAQKEVNNSKLNSEGYQGSGATLSSHISRLDEKGRRNYDIVSGRISYHNKRFSDPDFMSILDDNDTVIFSKENDRGSGFIDRFYYLFLRRSFYDNQEDLGLMSLFKYSGSELAIHFYSTNDLLNEVSTAEFYINSNEIKEIISFETEPDGFDYNDWYIFETDKKGYRTNGSDGLLDSVPKNNWKLSETYLGREKQDLNEDFVSKKDGGQFGGEISINTQGREEFPSYEFLEDNFIVRTKEDVAFYGKIWLGNGQLSIRLGNEYVSDPLTQSYDDLLTIQANYIKQTTGFFFDDDLTQSSQGVHYWRMPNLQSFFSVGMGLGGITNYAREKNDNVVTKKQYVEDLRVVDRFRLLNISEELNEGDAVPIGYDAVKKEFVTKPVDKSIISGSISNSSYSANYKAVVIGEVVHLTMTNITGNSSNNSDVNANIGNLPSEIRPLDSVTTLFAYNGESNELKYSEIRISSVNGMVLAIFNVGEQDIRYGRFSISYIKNTQNGNNT